MDLALEIAFEAGLHRCPDRFIRTFRLAEERELRKRIFYSLYSLERLLSAEFGIPLTMNDTDIDTCLPGDVEQHHTAEEESPPHPARMGDPQATTSPRRQSTPVGNFKRRREQSVGGSDGSTNKRTRIQETGVRLDPRLNTLPVLETIPPEHTPEPLASEAESIKNARLQPALALVRMTGMVGKAMETFNKSLDHRHDDDQSEFTPCCAVDPSS